MNELKMFTPVPTKAEVRGIMSKVRRLFNFYRFGELYGLEPADSYCDSVVVEKSKTFKDRMSYYDWLGSYRKACHDEPEFYIAEGATKTVLIPRDNNVRWVVKVPIPRLNKENYWYSVEEANIYKEAKEEKLSQYFAATYVIGEFKGVPIVLQQRLSVSEPDISSIFVNYSYSNGLIYNPCASCEYACDGRYNSDCTVCRECDDAPYDDDAEELDDDDRLCAIFGYDWNYIYSFLEKFCQKNHTCMDLHSGNYGFVPDTNDIVIMDFCGY